MWKLYEIFKILQIQTIFENFYSVPSVALYVNIGIYAKQWIMTGSRIGPSWHNEGWSLVGVGLGTL